MPTRMRSMHHLKLLHQMQPRLQSFRRSLLSMFWPSLRPVPFSLKHVHRVLFRISNFWYLMRAMLLFPLLQVPTIFQHLYWMRARLQIGRYLWVLSLLCGKVCQVPGKCGSLWGMLTRVQVKWKSLLALLSYALRKLSQFNLSVHWMLERLHTQIRTMHTKRSKNHHYRMINQ